MLLVDLFVCFVRVSFSNFISSSCCRGLAGVCECGTLRTFLLARSGLPSVTGCSSVGGCRISEINKGDLELQGQHLSIFISRRSTVRD